MDFFYSVLQPRCWFALSLKFLKYSHKKWKFLSQHLRPKIKNEILYTHVCMNKGRVRKKQVGKLHIFKFKYVSDERKISARLIRSFDIVVCELVFIFHEHLFLKFIREERKIFFVAYTFHSSKRGGKKMSVNLKTRKLIEIFV